MIPVLTAEQVRAADAAALATTPMATLVERAGTAVAFAARRLMGGTYGRRVLVLAGPGSNGADGRVAAELLTRWGASVQVLALADAPAEVDGVDLYIDAALGTGLARPFTAPQVANGVAVLAVDLPSGVDADTGEAPGQPAAADLTVTFQCAKPGLLQGQGRRLAGRVVVVDLGIELADRSASLLEPRDLAAVPWRGSSDHKWSHAVGVVGGSAGMEGAVALCAAGAMRAGATGVRAASIDATPPSPPVPPEVVRGSVSLAELGSGGGPLLERCAALVVGPGLGTSASRTEAVLRLLAATTKPLVLDADGLHGLTPARLAAAVEASGSRVVLTPHDGEAAALLGRAPGEDRLAAAGELATATGCTVLLKGPTTVVANPAGDRLVVTSGDERLATPGSGDVLGGVVGAFLALGLEPLEAAGLGALAHGLSCAQAPASPTASELPAAVAAVLARARQGWAHG